MKRSLDTHRTTYGSPDIKAVPGKFRKLLTSVTGPTPLFTLDSGLPDHIEYTETNFGAQVLMTLDHSGCETKSPSIKKIMCAYRNFNSFDTLITSVPVSSFYALSKFIIIPAMYFRIFEIGLGIDIGSGIDVSTYWMWHQSAAARLKSSVAYGPGTSFKASIKRPEGSTRSESILKWG